MRLAGSSDAVVCAAHKTNHLVHPALRTVGKDDLGRRVAVHRAAWHPSARDGESYQDVASAYPYRPELDCVLEAPDGSFASYCLAWLDPTIGVGELEPVGTDPRFARQGFAAAVCAFALWQLRRKGALCSRVRELSLHGR